MVVPPGADAVYYGQGYPGTATPWISIIMLGSAKPVTVMAALARTQIETRRRSP
jgi:hypothetical protein